MDQIFSDYPPQLSEDQLVYLTSTLKNWTIHNSLVVRPSAAIVPEEFNPHQVLATNAPVTLFPSPFPKKNFEQARNMQKVYNELYAAISSSEEWLESVLGELVEVDEFLAQLWKIHLAVKKEGYAHEYSLGLFRSDYMLDLDSDNSTQSLKQVEFNTISSSFGGLASLVTNLHTELATFPTPAEALAYPKHALFANDSRSSQKASGITTTGHPPQNDAVPTLTAGLAAAHKAYGPSKSNPPLPQCILFLVQDNERNIFDQLALSSYLYKEHQIPSFRLPTSQILAQTTIPSKDKNPSRPLIYHPPSSPQIAYEITVVYFRALYAPTEYSAPTSWAARHHLERSAAIKCPTVLLHLSGSKKIQQVLTSIPPDTDHLTPFLPSHPSSTIADLRTTFAPQYSLTSKEGLDLALNPDTAVNHVLKPQREGGGNNIYRTNIPPFLKSIPEKDYKQYILMELIKPPAKAKNIALRSDGQVVSGDVISELGIFGTCLWKTATGGGVKDDTKHSGAQSEKAGTTIVLPEILYNTEGGYLLRTKARDSDEGGVAAGFSSLDSLILFETV